MAGGTLEVVSVSKEVVVPTISLPRPASYTIFSRRATVMSPNERPQESERIPVVSVLLFSRGNRVNCLHLVCVCSTSFRIATALTSWSRCGILFLASWTVALTSSPETLCIFAFTPFFFVRTSASHIVTSSVSRMQGDRIKLTYNVFLL